MSYGRLNEFSKWLPAAAILNLLPVSIFLYSIRYRDSNLTDREKVHFIIDFGHRPYTRQALCLSPFVGVLAGSVLGFSARTVMPNCQWHLKLIYDRSGWPVFVTF